MKHRVLIVEDEADARESLARALSRQGYECATAATFAEGEAAADRFFDAAVVDLVLGTETEGGLRLLARYAALPNRPALIVVTAFADVARVKQALNAGAAFLLEKPFTAAELTTVLARVLQEAESSEHFVDRALARVPLTDKELRVARLLLKGLPTLEIARLEGNSDKTVRQHVTAIYAKCEVQSRAEFFHYVFPS